MKKLLVLALTLMAALTLIGCSVNASKLDDEYMSSFMGKISYAKDHRTGLCFAMVASRKTGSPDSTGIGLTEVDCAKVANMLTR